MTPEEKDEIDRQLKNFFTSQFKIYSDVSSIVGGWKVGVWALGVLVSAATIFGISKWVEIDNFLDKQRGEQASFERTFEQKLDQLVDERIAARAAKFDDLYLASTLATNGQYQEAYSQIITFLNHFPSFPTGGIRSLPLSNTQREFLFSTSLSILSQNYQRSGYGLIGSQIWDAITSSREILEKIGSDDNWRTKHNVKFKPRPEELKKVKRNLTMALSNATEPNQKSKININLFFTALVEERQDDAVSFALAANSNIKDSLTATSYQERDGHWLAWQEFATSLGVNNLEEAFQKAVETMAAVQAKKELEDKIKQIQSIDATFSGENFEEATRALFKNIAAAYISGDLTSLKERTSLPVFATFVSLITARQSRGETQSTRVEKFDETSILDVRSSPGYVFVDVRLVTKQTQATLNGKREVIDGDPKHSQVFTDVWTVSRKIGAPMSSLRVINMQ